MRARASAARLCASIIVALAGAGCSSATALPPHGEALVVVDTDLPVPTIAGRLRVDLYSEEGTWFESRDIGRSDPRDWPASFSVFSDDDARERRVLVRLRAYPDGLSRSYSGERFRPRVDYREPESAKSLAELCANPPELGIGGRLTLREAGLSITEHESRPECRLGSRSGSVAARVTIQTAGTYRFYVADAVPYFALTTLFLRSRCEDPTSQIVCRSEPFDVDAASTTGHFPRFDATLEPGSYFLMTAGALPAFPSDITLEALPVDGPLPPLPPPEAGAAVESASPRLERPAAPGAVDPTPATEPLPSVAVDCLLLVRLVPGVRGAVRVTLRGACAGTMAKLGADPRGPDLATAETCVDAGDVRVRLSESPLDADLSRSAASVQGTFASGQPCEPGASTDAAACVPGGVFVLGSRLQSRASGTVDQATPERIAVVPRFWMDKHEVTVARFRDAVKQGLTFDPRSLAVNDSPFASPQPIGKDEAWCSWSTAPLDREDHALSCVSWELARAYCQSQGGDLPTEAQWEYAATAAARPFKTLYPWGDEEPTCERAVIGRSPADFEADATCVGPGSGREGRPSPVAVMDGRAGGLGDVTTLGIVGLQGGVLEWTRDSGASYASECWGASTLEGPLCWEEQAPHRTVRGSSWLEGPRASTQRAILPGVLGVFPFVLGSGAVQLLRPSSAVGLRCVYEAAR